MPEPEIVRAPHVHAVLRGEESKVTPLELFFDLVLVLALTQCTALMAHHPTWHGLAQGILVLGLLWWAWVGYAWLTSVIDPDEGAVRIVMFVAMAGLLVCALAVPKAFVDTGLIFAVAYAVVRAAHIWLFRLASLDDPDLRRSVTGLATGTALCIALLVAGTFADGWLQGGLWALALLLDAGSVSVFGSEGWKLVPSHFAERHGLILIIALGESIVAIGVGAEVVELDAGVIVASALGITVAATLWWAYFDVVARVAERRLQNAAPGKERNEIGRDSFSYLHFPMVAGIVLIALGLKKTLGHVEEHLHLVPAFALFGGAAIYLLAHVAFRWRNVHRFSTQRVVAAGICLLGIPLAHEVSALASVAMLAAILVVLIVYETLRFAELRHKMRSELG